jgi:hypothetical protein
VSDYYLRPAQLCHHETKLIVNENVETIPVVRKQTYDQYDISHYVRTILVAHVVNSSIIYVHILPYHTLVLFLMVST